VKILTAKTLSALALSAATLISVTPIALAARAQDGQWSLERRESWMQEKLDRAAANGDLTDHDARRAQKMLGGIMDRQAHLVSADGGELRPSDRRELERRLDDLNDTLHWARKEDAAPWRH
jgi:hypothetical protein